MTRKFDDMLVFEMVARAARAIVLCPPNSEIRDCLGYASVSGPSNALKRLEKCGLIAVQRFQRARVITIVAIGEKTAEPAEWTHHWRKHVTKPKSEEPVVDQKQIKSFKQLFVRPEIAAPQTVPDIRFKGCQWIEGKATERGFCNAPVQTGYSWCPEHIKQVFTKI